MRFKSEARKPVQPELVASKDASRPALTKVHLDVDNAQVVVTDSYMLARFPVELDEGDTSGPIPIEALKASRKPPLKSLATKIKCNSHVQVVMDGRGGGDSAPYVTLPRDSDQYTFPDARQLMDVERAPFRVGLNVAKLAALAKSFATEEVVLQFGAERQTPEEIAAGAEPKPSNLRAVYVKPLRYGDGEPDGILMPIRLNG